MNGTHLTLGALGLLALTAGRQGARNPGGLESTLERPRIPFEAFPPKIQGMIVEAAEAARATPILDFLPYTMRRNMALGRAMKGQPGADSLLFRAMTDYVVAGQNAYVVGPEMQQQLARTSLDAVQPWMVKPPYDAWALALPNCPWAIWGPEERRMLPVRGVTLTLEGDSGILSMVLWAPTLDVAARLEQYHPEIRRLDPAALREAVKANAWLGNDSYLALPLVAAFEAEGGIEGFVEEEWARVTENHVDFKGWPKAAVEETQATRAMILRIVFGVMLYLQAEGADLSPDALREAARRRAEEAQEKLARTRSAGKRKKLERGLPKASGGTVVWLGRRIEEDAWAHDAGEGGATRRRHWVRGHWKGQPRKHLRAIIWIQPYERGGGPERVTHRRYRLPEGT